MDGMSVLLSWGLCPHYLVSHSNRALPSNAFMHCVSTFEGSLLGVGDGLACIGINVIYVWCIPYMTLNIF